MALLFLTLVVAFGNEAAANLQRRSLRGVRHNSTSRDAAVWGNCTPPREFLAFVQARSKGLPTFARMTSSHAVYGVDDGDTFNIFAYDCAKQVKLLFVHIPKNAGTTIEELAAEGGIQWGMHQPLPEEEDSPCSEWHLPPAEFEGYNPYEDAETFCVTRDPWERMLSEYTFLLTRHDPSKVEQLVNHKLDAPCTVEGFNSFVYYSLVRFRVGDRHVLNCHLIPQWDYVQGADGRTWCTHILPIEDLTTQFNNLMAEHGISLRLPAHMKENTSKDVCPGLSNETGDDIGKLYSHITRKVMREVYASDFAHLGDKLS